jgi:uncharacterized protein (TIGR02444 family)
LSAAAGRGFWEWSLSRYAAAGVAPGALELQDRHGLNVNILLWCAWIAGRFSRPEDIVLRKAIDLTAPWSRDVVAPLRAARRALKSPPRTASAELAAALRENVKAAELAAERIEQELLAGLAAKTLAPQPEATNALPECRRLMARYAELAGAVGRPGFSTLLLDDLARALFPDAGDAS